MIPDNTSNPLLINGKIARTFTGAYRHIMGTCGTLLDSKYGHIPIPKNASSYYNELFKQACNWKYNNLYHNYPNKKFIVCLREPLDRWFTGITEYFYRYHGTIDITNAQILQLIGERITFDAHTEPQVNFISNIKPERLIFFKVDSNLNNNLEDFIRKELTLVKDLEEVKLTLEPHSNITATNPDKLRYISILKDYINSRSEVMNKINMLYAKDFELYNTVKFYLNK